MPYSMVFWTNLPCIGAGWFRYAVSKRLSTGAMAYFPSGCHFALSKHSVTFPGVTRILFPILVRWGTDFRVREIWVFSSRDLDSMRSGCLTWSWQSLVFWLHSTWFGIATVYVFETLSFFAIVFSEKINFGFWVLQWEFDAYPPRRDVVRHYDVFEPTQFPTLEDFELYLRVLLLRGTPVTVIIPIYTGHQIDTRRIYETPEGNLPISNYHYLLAVRTGRENNRVFIEAQDVYGVEYGFNGFFRMAPSVIIGFVLMRLWSITFS